MSIPQTLTTPLLPLTTNVLFPGLPIAIPNLSEDLVEYLLEEHDRKVKRRGDKGGLIVNRRQKRAGDGFVRGGRYAADGADEVFVTCLPVVEEEEELKTGNIGCLARVVKIVVTEVGDENDRGENVVVQVEGLARVKIDRIVSRATRVEVDVTVLREPDVPSKSDPELDALRASLTSLAEPILSQLPSKNLYRSLLSQIPHSQLADLLTFTLQNIPLRSKKEVLQTVDLKARFEKVIELVAYQAQVLEVKKGVMDKVKERVRKDAKEVILRQQLEAIKKELYSNAPSSSPSSKLSDLSDPESEYASLETAIRLLPATPRSVAEKELSKLKRINPMSAEYQVTRTYIETIIDVPWDKKGNRDVKIGSVKSELEGSVFGMREVKKRLYEFIAVHLLTPHHKPPILLLVGPPGVGKTSVAQSIARALQRPYSRISLGGVKDESEIRGHRRTYVGSFPGRVVNAVRKAGCSDPVLLLDEIDKLSSHPFHNPSSALLELLDPEQNNTFTDHYLQIPLDLSNVFFICTANDIKNLDMAILDRCEVVEMSGYSVKEKEEITKGWLLKKWISRCGLDGKGGSDEKAEKEHESDNKKQSEGEDSKTALVPLSPPPNLPRVNLQMPDSVLKYLIENYTMEAGVRQLERCLARICRYVALEVVEGEERRAEAVDGKEVEYTIAKETLEKVLGPPPYSPFLPPTTPTPGFILGLATTPYGVGSVLTIESIFLPNASNTSSVKITGNCGTVLQETVYLALTLLRTVPEKFGLTSRDKKEPVSSSSSSSSPQPPSTIPTLDTHTLHIHFASHATKKDGPSAGLPILVSLWSSLLRIPVPNVALTGEIKLNGQVCNVGGVKEKCEAARRAGVGSVVLPKGNVKDLEDDGGVEIRVRGVEWVWDVRDLVFGEGKAKL